MTFFLQQRVMNSRLVESDTLACRRSRSRFPKWRKDPVLAKKDLYGSSTRVLGPGFEMRSDPNPGFFRRTDLGPIFFLVKGTGVWRADVM